MIDFLFCELDHLLYGILQTTKSYFKLPENIWSLPHLQTNSVFQGLQRLLKHLGQKGNGKTVDYSKSNGKMCVSSE